MQESYEEGLASHFGLHWRTGIGNASGLSVHAEGYAGQPLSSESNSFAGRPCLPKGKATTGVSKWRETRGRGGV
jgi:hypothetical protein